MRRYLAFAYGLACYLLFFLSFLYTIGFVADVAVPKTIDGGLDGAEWAFWPSLLVNLALLALFALQHSGMARSGFKRWWTRIVPQPLERSTYVLLTSLVLIVLFWGWRPMPSVIWSVEAGAGRITLWGLQALGWGLVLYTTFLISHAHLFGVQQVHDFLKKRDLWEPDFQTPSLYRHVRHPMMIGFFFAFWTTPQMTAGHLLFAIATTGYILVALQLEERDLVAAFGDKYRRYRERVPMLIPWPKKKTPEVEEAPPRRV